MDLLFSRERVKKRFSLFLFLPVYARLFLAACAQSLRYALSRPYVVQARYAEQFTIAAPRPAFSSGPHVCTHTYVSECIRRAYVRAHAKKRSCSIAGVSAFRLDRARVCVCVPLSNGVDNEVEIDPRSMLHLLSSFFSSSPLLVER